MQTLAETLPAALNQLGNPRESALPQNTQPKQSARNKQQLTQLLSQTCALQKQYGKTQAELETLVEGFSWALAEYQMPEIIAGMREYIKTNSDIPAPADIIKIIEKNLMEARIKHATIDQLMSYREKGIPLTPSQSEELQRHISGN